MRIYPPIPGMARQAIVDTDICGLPIKKGQEVMTCVYTTHRHRDFWPNPEKFDPDRFLKKPEPFSYIPFLAGPRVCLGEQFAILEGTLILAKLLQRYDFKLTEDAPIGHLALNTLRMARPLIVSASVPRST